MLHSLDEVSIALEDPWDFLRGAEEILAETAFEVGRDYAEEMSRVNFNAFGQLAGTGALLLLVARTPPGEIVGYAVVTLSTDILGPRVVASLMLVFAKAEFPRLGLRLAKEARSTAREAGASAFWISKTRDSPHSWRMDVVARALGGHPVSETWEVPLGGKLR